MFRVTKMHYVVFDEAHMLKNMNTQRYEQLIRINVSCISISPFWFKLESTFFAGVKSHSPDRNSFAKQLARTHVPSGVCDAQYFRRESYRFEKSFPKKRGNLIACFAVIIIYNQSNFRK